jgi:DNA (cytosine-5)-methyltransferase 1
MARRAGSLCTGTGGLDLAAAAVLDTELAWVADPSPGPAAICAHHWPAVPNLGDIRAVDWARVPPVEVLCAGWPCEPASQAGRQKGIRDDRWLWGRVAAACRDLHPRPRLLVLENVPRLLSVSAGAAFTQVICDLAALGYVGRYGVFRASDAGVPHRRERVFVVARDGAAADTGNGHLPERARGAGRPRRERPPVRPGPAGDRAGGAGEVYWGKYGRAVRRWEAISGIPAPRPWEHDEQGRVVTSPAFTEWMMGLPPGWVTGVPGLTRSAQVEAIGRAVVPPAAELAITYLAR